MGVVILAGPSGSGKSHLGARLGWTVLRLDDFYRDADEPGLPRSSLGIVDWDDPRSWNASAAVDAIQALCNEGVAEVPMYHISGSARTGTHTLRRTGTCFIAEGLFAPAIVDACREAGMLDAAICLRLRRGWRLMKDEPRIVAEAIAQGCEPMSPCKARKLLSTLAS